MVSMNHEVHSCECCQNAEFERCDQPANPECDCIGCQMVGEIDAANRTIDGLLANKRQLTAELMAVYRELAAARRQLAHYDTHCHCLTQRRPAELWDDSVNRELAAKRASKEVA
jgi:hypothetical protein